jgi:hypothetical protein
VSGDTGGTTRRCRPVTSWQPRRVNDLVRAYLRRRFAGRGIGRLARRTRSRFVAALALGAAPTQNCRLLSPRGTTVECHLSGHPGGASSKAPAHGPGPSLLHTTAMTAAGHPHGPPPVPTTLRWPLGTATQKCANRPRQSGRRPHPPRAHPGDRPSHPPPQPPHDGHLPLQPRPCSAAALVRSARTIGRSCESDRCRSRTLSSVNLLVDDPSVLSTLMRPTTCSASVMRPWASALAVTASSRIASLPPVPAARRPAPTPDATATVRDHSSGRRPSPWSTVAMATVTATIELASEDHPAPGMP